MAISFPQDWERPWERPSGGSLTADCPKPVREAILMPPIWTTSTCSATNL
uniref:F GPI biosynthesis protein family Pig-F n=1 Tax=Siphoviridae sp. ctu3K14 TaxID=2826500 RepID=A0A8S5NAD6_9CAUD|nr:MAG TPA: F GPI biosynthesis protein family Pig-F [Siphoviridae sp. ctu3K14]